MFPARDKKRHLYEGLTRYNYFPNQKEGACELPPCFSTLSYTPEIVELLKKLPEVKEQKRRKLGYDQVTYSVTRHNNVPRSLALVHPQAHALLVKTIYDNWDDIEFITENENSIIKPYQHIDGRMIVMNYENFSDKVRRNLKEGFGKRFRVHTDISSCFHSIYSHSIPWAVLGFDEVKKQLAAGGSKHWSDELDIYQRKSKRNETQGVAIGPGTSSIVVELVLGAVDKALSESGFIFKRYIDDYICYCETYEQSQRFIQLLGKELSIYKLNINLHKTSVVELPEPTNADWITELTGSLPVGFIDGESNKRKLTLIEIVHYLDMAVRINKITPDGSVIKYAVKSMLRYADFHTMHGLLDYVINLAWHYPVLIPYLDILLDNEHIDANDYVVQLNSIISENAKNMRSDGMAWPLYYIKKYNLTVSNEAYAETLKSKDCMALLCLYATGTMQSHVIDFVSDLLCKSLYEKDQYWILLYQLYKDGHIPEPYSDGVFDVLSDNDVDFMPANGHTNLAQQYCNYINCPFDAVDNEANSINDLKEVLINTELKSFDEWKVLR